MMMDVDDFDDIDADAAEGDDADQCTSAHIFLFLGTVPASLCNLLQLQLLDLSNNQLTGGRR